MKLKLSVLLFCLMSSGAHSADLASQLAACQKLSDENQRLACFDRISKTTMPVTAPVSLPPPAEAQTAVSAPAPVAAPAPAPAPAPAASPVAVEKTTPAAAPEEFGAEQLKKPEPVEATELRSEVVKIEKDARKRMVLHLANGQQWLQLEVEYFYVKPGDTAIIRRAALSSFLLGTDRVSKTIRVRRVK
ncbi:hypothetical protein [Rheinheimera sp.]|uniref:hypothetical protein n=1 Tax=Rheinheimera sp. TaxID=1869214 RepID=UPI002FDEB706